MVMVCVCVCVITSAGFLQSVCICMCVSMVMHVFTSVVLSAYAHVLMCDVSMYEMPFSHHPCCVAPTPS